MLRHLPDDFEAVCLRAGTEKIIGFMIVWHLFNFENGKRCYWHIIVYLRDDTHWCAGTLKPGLSLD